MRGLAADRVGDAVDLRWTAPTRTTDGLSLNGKHNPTQLDAEICREATSAAGCLALGRVKATSGQVGSFHDVLPQVLASGPPRILLYRVHMLNGNGKGAATASVAALAGQAPDPLQSVQAAPAQDGVLLRWKPGRGAGGGRILLRVKRGNPENQAALPGESLKPTETLLSVETRTSDPAGTLDAGAKPGTAQQYSIAREQTVRIGGEEFSMRSAPVLIVVPADSKLPPLPPATGLEAVANTLGSPEIDLVWQPTAAAVGYWIFRAEGAGSPTLLTHELVRSLTYSDTAVRPGARYRYSVSSVGRDGIAGPRSSEVEEGVPDR